MGGTGNAGFGNGSAVDDMGASAAPVVQPTRPLQEHAVEPQRGLFSGGFPFRGRDEGDQEPFSAPQRASRPSANAGGSHSVLRPGGSRSDSGHRTAFGHRAASSPSAASAPKMGGRAVVALVAGIVAFAVCVVSPALGIVAGAVAIWLAGSRRKAGDKAGFALTARICGIVAIVLSIIAVFVALAAGSASVSALLGDAVDEARLGSQASFSMEDGAVSSDDEWKAVEAVAPRFERLKTGDEQMAAQVGSVVDAGFTQLTGFSLQDCGIDPAEYGAAAMEGFSYEIVLVSAYSGSDDGFVSADVTAKDAFDIFNVFSDSLGDYADSPECASASEDERRAKVGELLMEAVRQAPLYPDSYCSVDVRHEGDAWVVDEDSWNSEMDYLFGIA